MATLKLLPKVTRGCFLVAPILALFLSAWCMTVPSLALLWQNAQFFDIFSHVCLTIRNYKVLKRCIDFNGDNVFNWLKGSWRWCFIYSQSKAVKMQLYVYYCLMFAAISCVLIGNTGSETSALPHVSRFVYSRSVVFNLFRSDAHFQPGGLAAAHQCLQVYFIDSDFTHYLRRLPPKTISSRPTAPCLWRAGGSIPCWCRSCTLCAATLDKNRIGALPVLSELPSCRLSNLPK